MFSSKYCEIFKNIYFEELPSYKDKMFNGLSNAFYSALCYSNSFSFTFLACRYYFFKEATIKIRFGRTRPKLLRNGQLREINFKTSCLSKSEIGRITFSEDISIMEVLGGGGGGVQKWAPNEGFRHFLKFASLVFQDCRRIPPWDNVWNPVELKSQKKVLWRKAGPNKPKPGLIFFFIFLYVLCKTFIVIRMLT